MKKRHVKDSVPRVPKQVRARGQRITEEEEYLNKPKWKRALGGSIAAIGRVLLTCFLIIVITGCVIATSLTVYIMKFYDTENTVDISELNLNYTSTIYAKNSKGEWQEVDALYSNQNCEWADYSTIPDYVSKAFIAIEDKRFNEHQGVDWKRTFAAFVNMFIHMSDTEYGGSTITQQLIKNVTGNNAHRIDRKIGEIFQAMNLEREASKDEIMEAYLNIVPLTGNIEGVAAGAKAYFNKDISEVTVAEAAILAAITKNPSYYSPFSNYDNMRTRQIDVLYAMLEQEYISQEEYDAAKAEEVVIHKDEFVQKIESYNSYFVDAVIDEAIDDIMEEKGCDESYANRLLLTAGYKIYSTLDMDAQKKLEKVYESSDVFPTVSGATTPDSAFVITDYSGDIVAMVGSIGKKTGDRVWNNATMAKRQPGSTIKPLSAYSLAIQNDLVTCSTIVKDGPITLDDGSKWPVNYPGHGGYRGNVTLISALQRSTNTIPAKLVQSLTPKVSFDFLYDKLHINSLVRSEKINGKVFTDIALAPMSVGALTRGITPVELATAYQIFGNGGYYYSPKTYTKIEDHNGNVIIDKSDSGTRVLDEATSVIMNKMLQTVVSSDIGTGRKAKIKGVPIAAKTGTTTDNVDYWFVGLTPKLLGTMWYGYKEAKSLDGITSAVTKNVWKEVMSSVLEGRDVGKFPESDDVVKLKYCKDSGMIATSGCKNTATGYYKKTNIPDKCTIHSVGGTVKPETSSDKDSSDSSSKPVSSDTLPTSSNTEQSVPDASSTETSSDNVIVLPENSNAGTSLNPDEQSGTASSGGIINFTE